ncbi:hypothetical protein HMSP1_86 [Sinorhizobium phage HMSP1-Susan]|nr:hypothetical protein HMSP1_86 [Sinorhizobium phage HMSP1-Susan]
MSIRRLRELRRDWLEKRRIATLAAVEAQEAYAAYDKYRTENCEYYHKVITTRKKVSFLCEIIRFDDRDKVTSIGGRQFRKDGSLSSRTSYAYRNFQGTWDHVTVTEYNG